MSRSRCITVRLYHYKTDALRRPPSLWAFCSQHLSSFSTLQSEVAVSASLRGPSGEATHDGEAGGNALLGKVVSHTLCLLGLD